MAKTKEQIIRENIAYNATHTTQFKLSLNNETDKDIIGHLKELKNKQGYIKSLIRKDMAN